MEDELIINLYFDRNEEAINETDKKYGKYLSKVAFNILEDNEDSKECVNDTYLNTWKSIPPKRPSILRLFLAKITRNLAIDLYRKNDSVIKGKNFDEVSLEIKQCENEEVFEKINYDELVKALNDFMRKNF